MSEGQPHGYGVADYYESTPPPQAHRTPNRHPQMGTHAFHDAAMASEDQWVPPPGHDTVMPPPNIDMGGSPSRRLQHQQQNASNPEFVQITASDHHNVHSNNLGDELRRAVSGKGLRKEASPPKEEPVVVAEDRGEDRGPKTEVTGNGPLLTPGSYLKDWTIVASIGAGSFGETFTAVPTVPSRLVPPEVCIKVEKPERHNVLRWEVLSLKKVQSCPHVVRYVASGNANNLNYLVMEKLGPNLAELRRNAPHGMFDLHTTLRTGIMCIDSIEGIHELGVIHRDVKPSNFVIGHGEDIRHVYLIDFGLAKRHRKANGEVKPPQGPAGFRGTSRYASLNSHRQKHLGRVDDLWSLLFMLVEFATGSLPWRKFKDKDDIGAVKETTIGPQLVKHLPREFIPFVEHLTSLQYESRPDYDYLRSLLQRAISRRGYPPNKPLDWEKTLPQHHPTLQPAIPPPPPPEQAPVPLSRPVPDPPKQARMTESPPLVHQPGPIPGGNLPPEVLAVAQPVLPESPNIAPPYVNVSDIASRRGHHVTRMGDPEASVPGASPLGQPVAQEGFDDNQLQVPSSKKDRKDKKDKKEKRKARSTNDGEEPLARESTKKEKKDKKDRKDKKSKDHSGGAVPPEDLAGGAPPTPLTAAALHQQQLKLQQGNLQHGHDGSVSPLVSTWHGTVPMAHQAPPSPSQQQHLNKGSPGTKEAPTPTTPQEQQPSLPPAPPPELEQRVALVPAGPPPTFGALSGADLDRMTQNVSPPPASLTNVSFNPVGMMEEVPQQQQQQQHQSSVFAAPQQSQQQPTEEIQVGVQPRHQPAPLQAVLSGETVQSGNSPPNSGDQLSPFRLQTPHDVEGPTPYDAVREERQRAQLAALAAQNAGDGQNPALHATTSEELSRAASNAIAGQQSIAISEHQAFADGRWNSDSQHHSGEADHQQQQQQQQVQIETHVAPAPHPDSSGEAGNAPLPARIPQNELTPVQHSRSVSQHSHRSRNYEASTVEVEDSSNIGGITRPQDRPVPREFAAGSPDNSRTDNSASGEPVHPIHSDAEASDDGSASGSRRRSSDRRRPKRAFDGKSADGDDDKKGCGCCSVM